MSTNTTQSIIKGILKHGPDIIENCVVTDDFQKYLERIQQI